MMLISEDDQIKLRTKAYKELVRLEEIFNNKKKTDMLNNYKNRFNICESTYKIILKEHQIKNKGTADKILKLHMKQVPSAMKFAGYSIDKELLNRLFGSCKKSGNRSAKVLRDLVTHSINQSAVKEIEQREKELYKDMDSFLEIIRKK